MVNTLPQRGLTWEGEDFDAKNCTRDNKTMFRGTR